MYICIPNSLLTNSCPKGEESIEYSTTLIPAKRQKKLLTVSSIVCKFLKSIAKFTESKNRRKALSRFPERHLKTTISEYKNNKMHPLTTTVLTP